jgi:hypothetical protein
MEKVSIPSKTTLFSFKAKYIGPGIVARNVQGHFFRRDPAAAVDDSIAPLLSSGVHDGFNVKYRYVAEKTGPARSTGPACTELNANATTAVCQHLSCHQSGNHPYPCKSSRPCSRCPRLCNRLCPCRNSGPCKRAFLSPDPCPTFCPGSGLER